MADADLISLLPRLKYARVAVVGDCMIDRWVYGRAERISPEAPVPVFLQEQIEDCPGGAANVTANLVALGISQSVLIGNGRQPRPIKERFVVGRQQIFRRDIEIIEQISNAEADAVFESVAAVRPNCIILSDYGKGILTAHLCHQIMQYCKDYGVPVIVDPKGCDWSKYAGATVITPNQAESDDLKGDWPKAHVLLTRGDKGMQLWPVGSSMVDIPARKREVFDVTGAGDTVIAVLGACLAVGIDLESAARIANAAAGVVVSKSGTAVCTIKELEAELAR